MSESNMSLDSTLLAEKNENNPINEAELHKYATDEDSMKHVGDYDSKTPELKAMGQNVSAKTEDDAGEVNMEATMTADDIMRAGGFGARDDISSLLPVAIDSTDFEASLRDAREFEEPQGETSRPGLGWTDSMDKE